MFGELPASHNLFAWYDGVFEPGLGASLNIPVRVITDIKGVASIDPLCLKEA